MYTYLGITILGGIYGMYTFKRQSFDLRVLSTFLFFSTLFFVFQNLAIHVLEWSNNLAVGNTWTIAQFIILAIFYYNVEPSPISKNIQVFLFVSYLLLTAYSFSDINNIESFLSLPRYASGLIFIFYSIFTYSSLLKNPQEDLLTKPVFWINTSLFVFFSGTMVIYLFIEYLYVNYPEVQGIGWTLHNVLGVVRVLLIVYAIHLHMKFRSIGNT